MADRGLDAVPAFFEADKVVHVALERGHLLQHYLDAVGDDGGARDPDGGRGVLDAGWLLLDECDGGGSGLVDGVVGHLLLHHGVDEDFALFVATAVCGAAFEQVSLQTVVHVSEGVFVDVGDAGVQVIQTGQYGVGIVVKSGRKSGYVVGVVEESLCLKCLEEGEVTTAMSGVQVVTHEGDALLPVQSLVHVEGDFELSQFVG